jgi:hypothetical protein
MLESMAAARTRAKAQTQTQTQARTAVGCRMQAWMLRRMAAGWQTLDRDRTQAWRTVAWRSMPAVRMRAPGLWMRERTAASTGALWPMQA